MIFSNKINIFILCFISFIAHAMEEDKEKLSLSARAHLEPILKVRTVKTLAVFCKQAVAEVIKEEKNPNETLKLLRNHNDYCLQDILGLLSEEIEPEFEKIYEGLCINNLCYSGNNAAWSQNHYGYKYIHTFGVPEKKELSDCFDRGYYKSKSLECLYISPIGDEEQGKDFLFIVNNQDEKRYLHSTFHPDNITHALSCENGQIVIWYKKNGDEEWWKVGSVLCEGKITALKFAFNGWLYSSNEQGKTYVWWKDTTRNNKWVVNQLPLTKPIASIAASLDGSLVAFQHAASKEIEVIDWHSLMHRTLNIKGDLVAITPSNNILVSDNKFLVLFDLKENRKIYSRPLPLQETKIFQNIAAAQASLYLLKGKEQERVTRTHHSGSWPGIWELHDCSWTEEVMVNKTNDALYMPKKLSAEKIMKHLEKK